MSILRLAPMRRCLSSPSSRLRRSRCRRPRRRPTRCRRSRRPSAATSVTLTSATVPGTVDANGSPTTWYVEYGTTTSYGLKTPDARRRRGADARRRQRRPHRPDRPPRPTTSASSRRTPRASAAAPTARCAPTTPPKPLAPLATTGPIGDLGPRGVTVTGTVDPRGTATRYRFDWGTGTSLNRHTRVHRGGRGQRRDRGQRPRSRSSRTPATATASSRRARQAPPTARGARFTSPRAPALLTFALQANRVPYEGTAVVTGNATSAGAGRRPARARAPGLPVHWPVRCDRAQELGDATGPTASRSRRCCSARGCASSRRPSRP